MALKILLADDSMTAQNMGKKILVDAGYDVVAVSNGAAAIKKMASEHPDIAILDVYMPGYTGLEVCERVKASGETAKTPVLLTVGKMEAFNPEDVNRVKADGVMVKPFEATDLIAAVQSIAQRLLAPTPGPRLEVGTVQLRQGQNVSIEDTQRIAASMIPGAGHDDTLRIGAPRPGAVSHEEALRETEQQIKAFQDKSYHDWKDNAEHHLEEHEKEVAAAKTAAEMPVAAPEPAMALEVDPPAAEPAAMMVEHAVTRETPVFSAMAAAGVAAAEPYLNGTGPVPPAAEPATVAMPAFYTPPVVAEEPAAPLPEIAAHAVVPEPVTPPVVAAVEPAPVMAVEPVIEAAPVVPVIAPEPIVAPPMLEPVLEVAPVVPVVEPAPVLETSAPKTPGPTPVAPVAELEPTIAPPVEVDAAPAHELEITSPAQQHGAVVPQDAALVTESEDITQFATRFGVENAEPVHVGVVSDLTPEQLAAITTPVEEPILAVPEPPALEIPVLAVPAVAEVAPEPVVATPPPVLAPPVVSAPVTSTVEIPAYVSPVQEEVGTIHAVAPLDVDEPIVAYVPGITETQPLMAMPDSVITPLDELEPIAHEAVAQPAAVAEPEVMPAVMEPAAVVAEPLPAHSMVEPVVSAGLPEPVTQMIPVPVAAEAPLVEEPAPIAAVTPLEEPAPLEVVHAASPEPSVISEAHTPVIEAVESSLAAAAAVASAAGVAHILHATPAHVEEPAAREPEPVAAPAHEPFGDAALAEELAAALTHKETEERATAAAEVATAAALEPTAAAVAAPAEAMGLPTQDAKLAGAVARAFESLKPKLISEIIKELGK